MTDGDSLLKAVLANPADDLPRLVLADWLEENAKEMECGECEGQAVRQYPYLPTGTLSACLNCGGAGRISDGRRERAEFVRLQLESANWGDEQGTDPEATPNAAMIGYDGRRTTRHDLWRQRERELTLLIDYRARWFPEAGGWFLWNGGAPAEAAAPVASVRRGFIDEVMCTLADWCGGECGCCGGTGIDERDEVCSPCSGTGHSLVLSHGIVAVHPVQRVVVTGIEPVRDRGGGWFWPAGRSVEHPNPLPPEIWRMPQITEGEPGREVARSFATRDAAFDALSPALIAWAKSQPVTAR